MYLSRKMTTASLIEIGDKFEEKTTPRFFTPLRKLRRRFYRIPHLEKPSKIFRSN